MKRLITHTGILKKMEYHDRDIFDNPDFVKSCHDKREKQLLDIVLSPDFCALEISVSYGTLYLHKNVRNGYKWQLSTLASDGIFNGHIDILDDRELTEYNGAINDIVMSCRCRDRAFSWVTA